MIKNHLALKDWSRFNRLCRISSALLRFLFSAVHFLVGFKENEGQEGTSQVKESGFSQMDIEQSVKYETEVPLFWGKAGVAYGSQDFDSQNSYN